MKTLLLSFVFVLGLFSFNSFAVTDLADLTGQSLKPECSRTFDSPVHNEDEILEEDVITPKSYDEATVAGELIR